MKKIFVILLSFVLLIFLVSCKKKEAPPPVEQVKVEDVVKKETPPPPKVEETLGKSIEITMEDINSGGFTENVNYSYTQNYTVNVPNLSLNIKNMVYNNPSTSQAAYSSYSESIKRMATGEQNQPKRENAPITKNGVFNEENKFGEKSYFGSYDVDYFYTNPQGEKITHSMTRATLGFVFGSNLIQIDGNSTEVTPEKKQELETFVRKFAEIVLSKLSKS